MAKTGRTFLRQTCHRHDYSLVVQAKPDDPASREIIQLAGSWIRHHRVVKSVDTC